MSEEKKSMSDNILDFFTDEEKADMLEIQQDEAIMSRYILKKARFETLRRISDERKKSEQIQQGLGEKPK